MEFFLPRWWLILHSSFSLLSVINNIYTFKNCFLRVVVVRSLLFIHNFFPQNFGARLMVLLWNLIFFNLDQPSRSHEHIEMYSKHLIFRVLVGAVCTHYTGTEISKMELILLNAAEAIAILFEIFISVSQYLVYILPRYLNYLTFS